MTKWTTTLQSQISNAVESTFEDALQSSYFNSNKGLITTSFNVVGQAMGEVVRSDRSSTASKAEIGNLTQTKLVADIIIQTVMSDTNFIVHMARAIDELMDRDVEVHSLCEVDRASTTTAGTNLSNGRPTLRPTRPLKAPSDLESKK